MSSVPASLSPSRAVVPMGAGASRRPLPHLAPEYRALARCAVLVAPGLMGSGPDHWQSAWERRFSPFARVDVRDWQNPDIEAWARAIVEGAMNHAAPVIVVAHSFGCLATIHASTLQSQLIAGALLVAPADPERFDRAPVLCQVRPDFPTVLVSSDNDPWLAPHRVRDLASQWGSAVVSLGAAGHINPRSGFHEWWEGLALLDDLCRRVVN